MHVRILVIMQGSVKKAWWTLITEAIGMMAYKAMTNGDDDKPEDLAKSFIEELVN